MGVGISQLRVDPANLADSHQVAAYLISAAGSFFTHSTVGGKSALDVQSVASYAEDSAHASGDLGDFMLAVRNDVEGSLVGADGDYAPLQVDALGRLRVNADINVANDFVYAEDSAAASGDLGASVLLVRQDTLASSTSADGDYGNFKSTSLGELYVADSTARTSLASILAELQLATQIEDAAHASGDTGFMSLAVRNDTPGSLVSANGDYAPLQVDATGNLRVVGSFTVAGIFAEDSAHVSGDSGMQVLAVRKDANGSNVSADGDYASFIQWLEGSMKVVDIRNGSILQSQTSATSTASLVVATPLAGRKTLIIQNTGSTKIWVGAATVTTTGATAGIELAIGDVMEMQVGPAVSVYVIKNGAAASTVNILEQA